MTRSSINSPVIFICSQFRHTVIEVDPVVDVDSGLTVWNVTIRDEISRSTTTLEYDAVIICHGYVVW